MHSNPRRLLRRVLVASILGLLWLSTSCSTVPNAATNVASPRPSQVLQAGDVIRVSFPGAESMNTEQKIRLDGNINLNIVGEVQAADKTPAELEKQLKEALANQLVSNEVKVTVISSSFAVFVNGAVLRPGKIVPDRFLTLVEAIMEAGGFDYQRANPRAVQVLRNANGKTQTFTVDVQAMLEGRTAEPFYLHANDIVHVPEKFQWF